MELKNLVHYKFLLRTGFEKKYFKERIFTFIFM